MGATNMPKPEKVNSEPQTTATRSGSFLTSSIVRDSRVGTYSQDPMPTITSAK